MGLYRSHPGPISSPNRDVGAIATNDLWRIYRHGRGLIRRHAEEIEALRGISLVVSPGEVFGLVGPNGAGKTTLIKILTTLLLPSAGEAYVLGFDVARHEREVRQRISFVLGGEQGLYWRLSGEDNLQFFSDLNRVPRSVSRERIPELLRLVGLWERRSDRAEHYSKGMKQRLQIARALVGEPQVLFLDEPTIGLDPAAARKLREIIGEVNSRGATVFLTSHYMWEMEVLCDRIAVLNQGRVIALDTPTGLKRIVQDKWVIEYQTLFDVSALQGLVQSLPFVSAVSVSSVGQATTLRILTADPKSTIAVIQTELDGADLSRLVERPPSLEDAYLQLVGAES